MSAPAVLDIVAVQEPTMPDIDILIRAHRRKIKVAYLYQLTFPNDYIYIGCTTTDPLLRLYQHKHKIALTKLGPRYSDLAYALNKYNEFWFKMLVIGEHKYMLSLEKAAIRILDSTNEEIGYNRQVGMRFFPDRGERREL